MSSFALALSPVFSGGAWALTRADVEEDIAENDEIVELNIDLVNGKSYTFDGLSAECLKAAFENGGFSSAAVAFDEEENDFVLVEGTDAEGALFEFAVDGDNVSVKSTVAAGVDYPVQSFVDTLLFGCPVQQQCLLLLHDSAHKG